VQHATPTTIEQHDDESFSPLADRRRGARAFVQRAKTLILGVATVAAVIISIVDPAQLSRSNWGALAGLALVQVGCLVALRAGRDPISIAGVGIWIEATFMLVALHWIIYPVGPSAVMVYFVVAGSYFLSLRMTLALTLWCVTGLIVAAATISDWNEPWHIPPTALVTLLVGVLCAFIKSRVAHTELRYAAITAAQLDTLDRLQQVDSARDRLIANVSHELRTPLTATIGSIETMLRDDVAIDVERQTQLLQVARDGGRRLLVLVEDLLTLGATRPDSLDLSTKPEQLDSIAREAIEGVPGVGERAVDVVLLQDPPVRVDRLRMLQVVSNLVVNALHHGRGDIVVEVDAIDERAVLRVIDAGDGIPAAHRDELFMPFARFSSRSDSTGLGLAICRTIVEAHGGTIRYEHTDEPRTRFIVELPIDAAVERDI
jgi:signal transduction histidine kinase